MHKCQSCDSVDTIPYPWNDESDRFHVLREFYPEQRLCVDCEHTWNPQVDRLRRVLSNLPKTGDCPLVVPVRYR
jgi:hypothetical protein